MNELAKQAVDVFDVGSALGSVGGDWEFLTEVVGLIQAAWPKLLNDIREAMERRDLRAVERAARLAKAAAQHVSAKRAYDSALQFGAIASKGDLTAAQKVFASLEGEVEILQFFLTMLANPECPR